MNDSAVDFRSDTVTRPTPAMRKAMAEAIVGDDVLGDDPTVKALEAEFAATLGKEDALFCPSGSMCNLTAVCVWCRPGDEVLMEDRTHTFRYEGGGASRFAGVSVRTFERESGIPEVADLEPRIRSRDDVHEPRSRLFVLENTHNMAGGRCVPLERVSELAAYVHDRGLRMHVDGARLFNAATALGVEPKALAEPADSVMCCLSKGLGAPIGSCLAGDRDFIAEANRVRKALGGGMRQVGVIAAAGLIALREGPGHLAADHARARRLAEALAAMDGLRVDPSAVDTNIVMCDLDPAIDARGFVAALAEHGVLCFDTGRSRLRFVVHRDLGDAAVAIGIERIGRAAASATR